jgi:5-methylcytosine-specific restriction endonuclease McrA
MKRCCHCREEKPLDQFKRAKNRPDGLYPECRACCRARYLANRERNQAYARAYYAAHPEQCRAAARRYRAENPEKAAAIQRAYEKSEKRRAWRDANRARINERNAAWRKANRDYCNAYSLRWQKAHPESWAPRRHARKARKLGNGGNYTAMQWRLLKARYNYTCLCCGRREPDIKLTPDHVIPLARGGSNGIENIQPLCGSCNCRKYTDTTDYRPAPQLS